MTTISTQVTDTQVRVEANGGGTNSVLAIIPVPNKAHGEIIANMAEEVFRVAQTGTRNDMRYVVEKALRNACNG